MLFVTISKAFLAPNIRSALYYKALSNKGEDDL